MLVIALGMYLGHFGTVDPNGTKCVFVLYVIGLVLFGGAFSIAQYFDIEEVRSEIDIIDEYLAEWKANNLSQDIGNRHRPQTAEITTGTDDNPESNSLLTQAVISEGTSFAIPESIRRNSPTTSRSERRRRDQAKDSAPPDLETGNMEDSISKSGSEASSRSKSSIKGKERVGKKD
ncbi:hypothetical protein BCON_0369g00050 [Botryotinia convoluta]|uniref:Uncharacterized protein n=1 Tax=Botryotinia convoluta TaxID=54673 RepID=A0A4Z1HBU6_9HELO|nr:hypothetical protein BCON_0369g00050 [Botryotinia convoluta]